jgi:uncharacterized protein (DUF1697 family)
MARHAAFLRGINLGGRRLPMDELRRAFEELGLENVATFIASGNVIFDHAAGARAALESRIEAHLAASIGFDADTFVRPLARLEHIAGLDVVASARADGFNIHVIFLRREPAPAVEDALRALEGPDDRFLVEQREVLWLRRGRLTDSPVKDRVLQTALSATSTMRNMNTIERIVARFG